MEDANLFYKPDDTEYVRILTLLGRMRHHFLRLDGLTLESLLSQGDGERHHTLQDVAEHAQGLSANLTALQRLLLECRKSLPVAEPSKADKFGASVRSLEFTPEQADDIIKKIIGRIRIGGERCKAVHYEMEMA